MPYRVRRNCGHTFCPNKAVGGGVYCAEHRVLEGKQRSKKKNSPTPKDKGRASSSKRGYNKKWNYIRKITLKAYGIPKDQWKLYDIHHEPAYNPKVEPDHLKYTLIPILRSEHSKITRKGHRVGSYV